MLVEWGDRRRTGRELCGSKGGWKASQVRYLEVFVGQI